MEENEAAHRALVARQNGARASFRGPSITTSETMVASSGTRTPVTKRKKTNTTKKK